MQFLRHNYVLLYRLENDSIARVVDIYHMSEDYEGRFS